MSYKIYHRDECNLAYDFEETRRTGNMTEANAKPTDRFDEIEIPEPKKEFEEIFPVMYGRVVGEVGDKGYPIGEGSIEMYLQTGIWLAFILGGYAVTGTSYGTPVTDDVTSGGGTAVLTFTGASWTPDAFIGDLMEVTVGEEIGNIYLIIDNTADTLTLHTTTTAAIDGDTIEIKTAPFTHTLSVANELPTFKIHFEQKNAGTGPDVVRDLIGCVASEINISVAKEELVRETLSMIVAKSISATAFTTPGGETNWNDFAKIISDRIYNWEKTTFTAFKIDGVDLTSGSRNYVVESIDITITNDIELLPNVGDAWFDEIQIGKLEAEIVMMIFPKDDTLYNARDKHPDDYTTGAGNNQIKIKFNNGANNYIEVDFTKVYVSNYPNKIPTIDDKDVGVEVTFRLAPGGTIIGTIKDSRNPYFYNRAFAV